MATEKISSKKLFCLNTTRCIGSRLYRVETVTGCMMVQIHPPRLEMSTKRYSVKALMVMHQIFNLGNTDRYRVAELGDKAN